MCIGTSPSSVMVHGAVTVRYNVMMLIHADVISDYTEFGLFEGKFLPESEAVIIIGRDRDQPDKPTHRAIVFHRNIEAESSRLYLFNSVWDGQTEPGGETVKFGSYNNTVPRNR